MGLATTSPPVGASYHTTVTSSGTVADAVSVCIGSSAHSVWSLPTGAAGTDGNPGVVAVLSAASGSSASELIETVFSRSAVKSAGVCTVTVYVTAAPLGNVGMVWWRSPVPDASGSVTSPVVTAALQALMVVSAGAVSSTATSLASLGPSFVTVIVYTTSSPGT